MSSSLGQSCAITVSHGQSRSVRDFADFLFCSFSFILGPFSPLGTPGAPGSLGTPSTSGALVNPGTPGAPVLLECP